MVSKGLVQVSVGVFWSRLFGVVVGILGLVLSSVLLCVPAFADPGVGSGVGVSRWFSVGEDVVVPRGVSSVVRSRVAEFDASAAVFSVVSQESLGLAVVGERVVVPKVGDISLVLFDGEVFDVFVDEVAVTWQVMSGGLLPSVSVLGSYGSGGEPVAFVFVDGGDGRYVLSGVFDQGMQTQVEIRSQGENMVQISEVVPVVDGSSSGVSDAVLVGEDTTTGGEPGGEVGGGVSAFGVESAPRDANGNYVADVLIGYVQDQGISVPDIALSVENANSAYLTSGVKLRLNLFSLVPVTYTQVDDGMNTDLDNLGDGVKGLDVLLKRREALGADFTSLIVPKVSSGVCGRAWYSPDMVGADGAVSVVSATCLSDQTLAHELGHNMGLDHNRENASYSDPAAYNYGYQNPAVSSNTIMSYGCLGAVCFKKNQFSSPSVDFIGHPGFPSGTASEDNARKLNENAETIAGWRTSHVVGEGISGTVGWMVSDQGVLTFSSGKFADLDYSSGARPWAEYASVVNKVVFEDPTNTSFNRDASYFLWDFKNVTSIDGIGLVNTSLVEDTSGMFSGMTSLASLDLSKWDTTNVTSVDGMFSGADIQNVDLSGWDMPNLTDMGGMFTDATIANLDVSDWSFPNVTEMSGMFAEASISGGLDLSSWDTTNVADMNTMFHNANIPNINLSRWDSPNLTYTYFMFYNAEIVNLDVSNWTFPKVTDMVGLFTYASISGGLDLSSWDTTNISSMGGMFDGAKIPTLNLAGWNIPNLNYMDGMFSNTEIVNLDVSNWTFPNVTEMRGMFENASISAGLDLSSWDTTNISSMGGMFHGAKIPTLNLAGWNIPNLNYMDGMFTNATIGNLDVSNWAFPNVTEMNSVFADTSISGELDLSSWDTTNVMYMSGMFRGADIQNVDLSRWDMPNLTGMGEMFAYATIANLDVSDWSFPNVTEMSSMFVEASISGGLDLSSWDTTNITGMVGMFMYAKIPDLNLSGWNIPNIDEMNFIFCGTEIVNLDVSNWTFPKLVGLGDMFVYASISGGLDLSSWDTTNVMYMSGMFSGATIPTLNLSGWDMPNLTDMGRIFSDTEIMNLDLSNWTFPNVTRMDYMFNGSQELRRLDLSNWDTSNVTNMNGMFQDTPSLRELTLGRDTAFPVSARLGWSYLNGDNGNRWVNVGGGTVNAPEPTWTGNSSELTARSTLGIADTYVWE